MREMLETQQTLKVSELRGGKEQVALDKLFGLTHEASLESDSRGCLRARQGALLDPGIPAFGNLQEAYIFFTGDSRLENVGRRVRQIFDLPSFPNALASTVNKLLIRDFFTEYRWRDIVSSFTAPPDFRAQDRVRLGYVEDLPDVTEDEPYTEIPAHSDEKVSYSVGTKGALLTITRRALVNDDIGGIKRAVDQLGRAAWRTLAKRAWNKVINNDLYRADGVALFDAAHNNLGNAALSAAALTAARKAIFAQVEPGGADRLGLSGPFFLAVPVELEETALPINTARLLPGDIANPWFHRFGLESERIFANPLFEDAASWYLFDISGNAGTLEIGFLNGQQNPELFLSDDPEADPSLTQDRIVYKMRHEYEVEIIDYRGAYKSVAA
jgi:hypothetical protein